MKWQSLEKVWRLAGKKEQIKVRFNDWTQQIRYFVIDGETKDGKRFVGTLDSGEKMTFPKRSLGWTLYYPEAEYQAHAV